MKTDLSPNNLATVAGTTRWHGAIEGIFEGLLFGWAFDRERPDARVIVEICLDGMFHTSVAADMARTDLADMLGNLAADSDICHGFMADLKTLRGTEKGVLTARIANTDALLSGSINHSETKAPPAAAINSVVGDGGLRLFGWALDPSDPRRTLAVRAFVGAEMVAQGMANIILPTMRAYVDGAHGFDLALPSSLANGSTHTVRVVDENGNELNGSPALVCCTIDGLAALLPADTDPLAFEVAAIYERLVPRSLPMSVWPEWSARFDAAPPAQLPATVAALKTGIIITGVPDAAAIQRTAASVQQQGVAVLAFSATSFAAMLGDALAAGCDVIACVRAGDTLLPHALAYALEGFALSSAQVVYTDSEQNGHPWFKPAWNADYALSSDYPLELLLVRSDIIKGLPELNDQAAFAWSSLAAVWPQSDEAIVHVPRVLYQMNSALTDAERSNRAMAAARAIHTYEANVSLEAFDHVPQGVTHAARRVRASLPPHAHDITVSLVIPTRDRADLLKRCLDTIRKFTAWPKLEIIIIDNGSTEPDTHAYFTEIVKQGVRVLPMPGPFNYADLNNRAIALATGEIVGLVNNDIEALHDGWLDEIVAQLLRPGVGAVGAKLLWPNGMVQHGGVLLGVGNVAGHFGNLLADADWGDHGRNQLLHRVTACTAACLFLRKQDFLDLGGMDANAFPVAFNDVDLCLKVRTSGKTIIWTPHAKLLHAESASRGGEDTPQKRARSLREIFQLRQRWAEILQNDTSYHPGLSLDPNSHSFGGLAIPPRNRSPRLEFKKISTNSTAPSTPAR